MSTPEPTILDYASAPQQSRGRKISWYVAVCTGCIAVFAIVFIEPTYGSGVTRQSPIAAAFAYAFWGVSVLYIWLRIFEDRPRSHVLAGWIAVCGTVAIVAVPMQWRDWWNDPGHPQSRFRLELLWPGIIAMVALLGATVGIVLNRRLRRETSG